MTMKMTDIDLAVEPPKFPDAVAVLDLTAPSFEARRNGIELLREVLGLGEVRTAELDHGVMIGNERGDIEFFHASGAVWANDATAAREHSNELRKWPGLKKGRRGDQRAKLDAESSKKVLGQARDLLNETGLIGRDAEMTETVALDQVARLNSEGKEVSFGAGSATVQVAYAVEGLPVRGAGAKSMVFADPGSRGSVRLTGAFHVWRPLGGATGVKLDGLERALAVGLLRDPELERYQRSGHKVRVTKLELCYLALPAFTKQSYLFPALQVEGAVSEGKRGIGFNFARYHHVAAPKAYAEADLYAPYLATNPDGISPAGRARVR